MNPANSQDALAQLQQFQAGAKNPTDFLTTQQQQLGIPQAQQNIQGLRGAITNTTKLLNQIAPSIMGRTANSLVTNAQAVGQIQNAQAPIAQQLNTQTGNLNTANTDLNTLQAQAEQAAQGQYLGQENQRSYLQNLYDVLYKRESDAQAAAQAEADRQEQIRQFNASLKAQAAAANPSFGLPSTADASQQLSDPVKEQAKAAVYSLFATNNPDVIRNTITAIQKSAGYGNPYDQLKLQLIQALHPEYLAKTGISTKLPNLMASVASKVTGKNAPTTLKTNNVGLDAANNVLQVLGMPKASF